MEQQTLFPGYEPRKRKTPVVREVAPAYWTDFEILTLLLGINTAKSILKLTNENLLELHNYEPEQLCTINGIGKKKSLRLKAALELGRRIAQGKRPQALTINSPREIANYLMEEMRYYTKEYFKIVLLNTKNTIISIEDISVGSLNSSIVHPREIFNIPVKKSAASILLAHNHPSGDPLPSFEDIDVTKRLVDAGTILGIKVLDHIIIGDNQWVSFKEKGLI